MLFDVLDAIFGRAHHTVRDCTMIDWDDVRYFLAVAREGSVRAAAGRLGVNHATVLRRMAQLEERLGAQMFEKLPSGYRSEEHTSELQSLMRISYAVFCLKKTNTDQTEAH